MSVKMNKKIVAEMKVTLVTFLVHLFPYHGKLDCWGKYKRESLESNFLRASSEKNSSLQETISLLNQCIGQESLKLSF